MTQNLFTENLLIANQTSVPTLFMGKLLKRNYDGKKIGEQWTGKGPVLLNLFYSKEPFQPKNTCGTLKGKDSFQPNPYAAL